MNFNIDIAIFVGFLMVNLIFGLRSSHGIKNIKEYAVGNGGFKTSTLVATTTATWMCGETFFSTMTETYEHGLYFLFPCILGFVLGFFIIGYFLAPKMKEFLGKISIAEAMGELYGNKVRLITTISGFIGVSGFIAVQLTISGIIFNYVFGIDEFWGVIISGLIITIYSSLGGIKSVTFTDVIQIITFGTVIPIIAYHIFDNIGDMEAITETLRTNPNFDLKKVFDLSEKKSLYYFSLFLFCMVPCFNPAEFQRVSMARNIKQVSNVFYITGICIFFIMSIIAWFSLTILSSNPAIPVESLIKEHVFASTAVGYKGLLLVGITAMVMSTADSYINCSSVLFTHDFCKALKIQLKNELLVARITSFCIGVSGILLALTLKGMSLFNLAIFTASFWLPVATVPFLLAICGYRTPYEKPVLYGMGGGLFTVLAWNYYDITEFDPIVPGMLVNFAILMCSHYLLSKNDPKGGWVGTKDLEPLHEIRHQRNLRFRKCLESIKSFNILKACNKNCPKGDGLISILGLFVMISAFGSTHTLTKESQLHYAYLLDVLYPITLCTSSALISYPLWLPKWKESGFIGVCWNLIMFFVLICFSFLMVLISNFSEVQFMVFMVNLIILSSLATWRWALFTIITGVAFVAIIYHQYLQLGPQSNLLSSQLKIVYLLMLISSTLIIFLKPKQQHQELTEERNEHLVSRINIQENEIQEALALKAEFIRNVSHEYHAPMTGVISMAEGLQYAFDKISDEQKKKALDVIVKSSYRLKTYDENITTLARLSKPNYKLNKEEIDFSQLIYDRVQTCRKLYDDNKEDREFVLDIAEDIKINADMGYMIQLLDNLIINSISYCKKGQIKLTLSQNEENITFMIEDEGIGIPQHELSSIFEPFMVSSKTKTPAGGRGMGLSICKRILEVHSSTINAESNGEKGAIFRMMWPRLEPQK